MRIAATPLGLLFSFGVPAQAYPAKLVASNIEGYGKAGKAAGIQPQ